MHFVRSMPALAIIYAIFFTYTMGDAQTAAPPKPEIYLSENIKGGTQLRFSDGSLYEVAPKDRDMAQLWITPFSASFEPSSDPAYPIKITNAITGSSVNAKKIS